MKLVFCCRRRQHISLQEFQQYWLESHAALVRSLRSALPSMTRYVQSHMQPEATELVRGSRDVGEEPYDGVTEIWIDLEAATEEAGSAAGIEAMKRLLEDELTFVDMERSTVFMTVEHDIF